MKKSLGRSILLIVAAALSQAAAPFVFAQTPTPAPEASAKIFIQPGYNISLKTDGLDFPSAIAFSGNRTWVSESGITNTTAAGTTQITQARIKEIDSQGRARAILNQTDLPDGTMVPPLTDVTYRDGWLWVSHRQRGINGWNVGAISRFQPDNARGTFTTVLSSLPSAGDYSTNEIMFDSAGRAYFCQGTATNSGVVGPDNYQLSGWPYQAPKFHDYPAVGIALSGASFITNNPQGGLAMTGPFSAYNSEVRSEKLEVGGASLKTPQDAIIAGVGAVYSFDPARPTENITLEAWGLRNPGGMAFDPFSPRRLFVSNQGCEVRTGADGKLIESRPVASDRDDLFSVDTGGEAEFFGWPDFFHDNSLKSLPATDPLFCAGVPDGTCPKFLFSDDFRRLLTVQPAFSELEYHALTGKMDVSQSLSFGLAGNIFIAEPGGVISTGGTRSFSGYKILRVDRQTGKTGDFIGNAGTTMEEFFNTNGLNKPVDVKFTGDTMLIVDYGVYEPSLNRIIPGTGKIWTVTRSPGVPAPTTSPTICPTLRVPNATATFPRPCPGMQTITVTPRSTSATR